MSTEHIAASDLSPARTDALPAPDSVQILSSIRFNLQDRVAPELKSPMAQHVCRMSQQLLGHQILMETEWPAILARQLQRQSAALLDAAGILRKSRALDGATLGEIAAFADEPLPAKHLRSVLEQRNRRANAHLETALLALYSLADTTQDPAVVTSVNRVIRDVIAACADTERDYKKAEQDSIDGYAREAASRAVITPEGLQSYLRTRFTDRENLRVLNARELPGGFGKMTLLFDVEGFESGISSLVMRRDRPNGATETTVADEFPLLREMNRCGLPVAEPLWLENSDALDYPFIVVRRVEGQAGGDLWRPDPAICTAKTGLDLAQILARLHSLDPAGLQLGPALRPKGRPEDTMPAILAGIRELWMRKRLEPDAALQASLCWLEHNVPPAPATARIIHSDVGFHNLLVKDEKISGLLDWELTHLGDPVEDLSYVRPYVEQLIPWPEFLAAYGDAGGGRYAEDIAHYFGVWRGVRNTIYTLLCHHAFCTDANLDLRFGHAGVYYPRLILLEAANKVAQLGMSKPNGD
jgi:aminoglycoside phosphotransferase (APT) family kinase protein